MALTVVEQVWPETVHPFRIVETYQSIDGTRTRMTHRTFSNKSEAIEFAMSFNQSAPDFKEID
jgi:hypothetical protein